MRPGSDEPIEPSTKTLQRITAYRATFSSKPGEHGGHRRRAFGMSIGQPVVQRRQADLGPISDQKKDEREAQHPWLELPFHGVEVRPEQRGHAFAAKRLLCGKVQQDRAEQRLGDADAAEDEILPRRFEAGARAVERNQQHRRQRGGFHRDPEQAHVVGQQRQQHRRHEELVHAVVEAQARVH